MDQFIDLDEHGDGHLELSTEVVSVVQGDCSETLQYLKKIIRLLVCLGEETQRESGNCIVAPRSEKGDEESLAVLPSY